jgi:hypothetical protein
MTDFIREVVPLFHPGKGCLGYIHTLCNLGLGKAQVLAPGPSKVQDLDDMELDYLVGNKSIPVIFNDYSFHVSYQGNPYNKCPQCKPVPDKGQKILCNNVTK